ncbi:MAG: hypothetical protein P8M73_04160 [Luminiphilus sp.]|nr:hypothetical protein [Luminiphilus sp.]
MNDNFVIRNQLGHYWSKSGSWISGARIGQIACWDHHDEAVNTLFELSSKDMDLRGEVIAAKTDGAQLQNLEISERPVPKIDEEGTLETSEDAANE